MQNNELKNKKRKFRTAATITALGILIPATVGIGVGVAFAPYTKKLTSATISPTINILNSTDSTNKTVLVNSTNVNFSVLATINNNEGATLSYHWYSSTSLFTNGVKLLITNNTLDISNKLFLSSGTHYFYCIVKAVKNGTEIAQKQVNFTLNVINTPVISYASAYTTDATLNESSAYYQTIEPNVTVSNDKATLNYQWYKSTSNNITNISAFSTSDLISGATNNYYTLTSSDVSATGTFYYYLYTTGDISGNTFSKLSPAYTLVVSKNATINVSYNQTNVSATTGYTGSTLTANVSTSSANLALNYAWYTNNPVYKNDGTIVINNTTYYLIPNANNSYYTLTTTDTSTTGNYVYGLSVTTTQNGIKINSSSKTNGINVDVVTTPTLTITNPNNFKYTGVINQTNSINLTMKITVSGGDSSLNSSIGFTYQWYEITDGNSTILSGQTNSVLTLTQDMLNTASSFYYAIVTYTIPNTNSTLTATTPTYSVTLTSTASSEPTPTIITSTVYATNNETNYQTLVTSINTYENTNEVLNYQWYTNNPAYANESTTEINGSTYYIIPNANSTTYTLTSKDVHIGNASSVTYQYWLVQTATNTSTNQNMITNSQINVIISAQAEVKWTNQASSSTSISTSVKSTLATLPGSSTSDPIVITATQNQISAITTNLSAYIANANSNINNYDNSDIVYQWYKTDNTFSTTGLTPISSSTNSTFSFNNYISTIGDIYFVVYATYSINGITSTSTPMYYELNVQSEPTLTLNIPNTSYTVYQNQENTVVNFNVNYTLNSNTDYNTTGLTYTWYAITSNTIPTNMPNTNKLNGWTKLTNTSSNLTLNTFSSIGTTYYYVIVSCTYNGLELTANNANNLMHLTITAPVTVTSSLDKLSTLNTANTALTFNDNYSGDVYTGYSDPVVLGVNNTVNNLINNNNIIYTYMYTLNTTNASTKATTSTTFTSTNNIFVYDNGFNLPVGSSYRFSVQVTANIYNSNGQLISSITNNISDFYTFNITAPDTTNNQASISFSTNSINTWINTTKTITPLVSITGYNDASTTYTWYNATTNKAINAPSFTPSYDFSFDTIGTASYYVVMTISNNGYTKTITSNTLTINTIGISKNAPDSIKNLLPTINITATKTTINTLVNTTTPPTLLSSTSITNPANLNISISYSYSNSINNTTSTNTSGIYSLTSSLLDKSQSFTITMTPIIIINGVNVSYKDFNLTPITYTINVTNAPTSILSAINSSNPSSSIIIYQGQSLVNTLSVLNTFSNVPSFLNSADFGTSYVWSMNGSVLNNNNSSYQVANNLSVGNYTFSVYGISTIDGVTVTSNTVTFDVKVETLNTTSDISGTIKMTNSVTIASDATSYNLVPSINIINNTNTSYETQYVWSTTSTTSAVTSFIDTLNNTNNGLGTSVLTMTSSNDFFKANATYTLTLYVIVNGLKLKLASASTNLVIADPTSTILPKISINAITQNVNATLNETSYQTLSNTLSISNNTNNIPVDVSYTWTKKADNTSTILSSGNASYDNNTTLNFAYTLTSNDVNSTGSYEIVLSVTYSIYGNSSTSISTYSVTVTKPVTITPSTSNSSDSSSSNTPNTSSSWTNSTNNANNPINPTNPSSPYYKDSNVTYTTYTKNLSVYVGQTLNLPTLYASLSNDYAYSYNWLNANYQSINDTSAIYQLTNNDIKNLTAGTSTTFTLNVTLNQNGIISITSFVFNIKAISLPDVTVTALNPTITAIKGQSNNIYLYTSNNNTNTNVAITYTWNNDSNLTAYGSYAEINSSAFNTITTLTYTVTPTIYIDGASATLTPITFTINIKNASDVIVNNATLNLNNQSIVYGQSSSVSLDGILSNDLTGDIVGYTWYKLNSANSTISSGVKLTAFTTSSLTIDPTNYNTLGITTSGTYYYALVLTLNYHGSTLYLTSNTATVNVINISTFNSDISVTKTTNTYNVFYNQTSNLPTLTTNTSITYPTGYNMQVYYLYSTSDTAPTSNLTNSNIYTLTSTDIKDQTGPLTYYLYYQIVVNGVCGSIIKSDNTYTINITKPSVTISANNYTSTAYIDQNDPLFLSANAVNSFNADLTYTWTYSINNGSYEAIPTNDITSNNGTNITLNKTLFANTDLTNLSFQLVVSANDLNGSSVRVSYSNDASSLIYNIKIFNPNNAITITYPKQNYTVIQNSTITSITPTLNNDGFFTKAGINPIDINLSWYTSSSNTLNTNDLSDYTLFSKNTTTLTPSTSNLGTIYYFFVISITLNGTTYYYTTNTGIAVTTIAKPSASDFITYSGKNTNSVTGFVGQNNLWLKIDSSDIKATDSTNYNTAASNNIILTYQWTNSADSVISTDLNYLLPNPTSTGTATYTLSAIISVNDVTLSPLTLTTYTVTINTPTININAPSTSITQTINTTNPSTLTPIVTNNFNGLITYKWYESSTQYTSITDIEDKATTTTITTPTYTLPIKTSTQTIYYYLVATANNNSNVEASNFVTYSVIYVNNTISTSNALSIHFSQDTYYALVGQDENLSITPNISGSFNNYSDLAYTWTISNNTAALTTSDLSYTSTSSDLIINKDAFSTVGTTTLTLTLSGNYNNAPFSISKSIILDVVSATNLPNNPNISVTLNNTNSSSDPIYLLDNQNYYLTVSTNITNSANYSITISYSWYKNNTLLTTTTTPYLSINAAGTYSVKYSYSINGVNVGSDISVSNAVYLATYNTNNFQLSTNQTNYTYYTYNDSIKTLIQTDLPTITTNVTGASTTVTYAWYYGTSASGSVIGTNSSLDLNSISNYLASHKTVNLYLVATTILNNTTITRTLTFTLTNQAISFNFAYSTTSATLNTDMSSALSINTNLTSSINDNLITDPVYTWTSTNSTISANTSANFNKTVTFNTAGTYSVTTSVSFTYLGMKIDLTTSNTFVITVTNMDFSSDSITINANTSYFLNQTSNTTITPLVNISNNLNQDFTYTYQWMLNNTKVSTNSTYTINTNEATSNTLYLIVQVISNTNQILATLKSNTINYTVYDSSIFSANLTTNNSIVYFAETSNLPTLTATLNTNNNTGLSMSNITYTWTKNGTTLNNSTSTYDTVSTDFNSQTAPTFNVVITFDVNGVSVSLNASYKFSYSVYNITNDNTLNVNSSSSVVNYLYNQTNHWYVFTNQTTDYLTYTYTWNTQNLQGLSNHNLSNIAYTFNITLNDKTIYTTTQTSNTLQINSTILNLLSSNETYYVSCFAAITINGNSYNVSSVQKAFSTLTLSNSDITSSISATNTNVYTGQTSNLPYLTNTSSIVINNITIPITPSYTWTTNGATISTTNAYQTIASSFTNAGNVVFSCLINYTVAGFALAATSGSVIKVTNLSSNDVSTGHYIINQTVTATQYYNQNITLGVNPETTVAGILSYTWYESSNNYWQDDVPTSSVSGMNEISNNNFPTYTITNFDTAGIIYYYCVTTLNVNGATTSTYTKFTVQVNAVQTLSVSSNNNADITVNDLNRNNTVLTTSTSLNYTGTNYDDLSSDITGAWVLLKSNTGININDIDSNIKNGQEFSYSNNSTTYNTWSALLSSGLVVGGNNTLLLPAKLANTAGTYYLQYISTIQNVNNSGLNLYAVSNVFTITVSTPSISANLQAEVTNATYPTSYTILDISGQSNSLSGLPILTASVLNDGNVLIVNKYTWSLDLNNTITSLNSYSTNSTLDLNPITSLLTSSCDILCTMQVTIDNTTVTLVSSYKINVLNITANATLKVYNPISSTTSTTNTLTAYSGQKYDLPTLSPDITYNTTLPGTITYNWYNNDTLVTSSDNPSANNLNYTLTSWDTLQNPNVTATYYLVVTDTYNGITYKILQTSNYEFTTINPPYYSVTNNTSNANSGAGTSSNSYILSVGQTSNLPVLAANVSLAGNSSSIDTIPNTIISYTWTVINALTSSSTTYTTSSPFFPLSKIIEDMGIYTIYLDVDGSVYGASISGSSSNLPFNVLINQTPTFKLTSNQSQLVDINSVYTISATITFKGLSFPDTTSGKEALKQWEDSMDYTYTIQRYTLNQGLEISAYSDLFTWNTINTGKVSFSANGNDMVGTITYSNVAFETSIPTRQFQIQVQQAGTDNTFNSPVTTVTSNFTANIPSNAIPENTAEQNLEDLLANPDYDMGIIWQYATEYSTSSSSLTNQLFNRPNGGYVVFGYESFSGPWDLKLNNISYLQSGQSATIPGVGTSQPVPFDTFVLNFTNEKQVSFNSYTVNVGATVEYALPVSFLSDTVSFTSLHDSGVNTITRSLEINDVSGSSISTLSWPSTASGLNNFSNLFFVIYNNGDNQQFAQITSSGTDKTTYPTDGWQLPNTTDVGFNSTTTSITTNDVSWSWIPIYHYTTYNSSSS